MDPTTRSAAATLDHSRWLTGELSDAEFVAATSERMTELRQAAEGFQRDEEAILALRAACIQADLAEALCEYVADRPRGAQESGAGAERRALLTEAARLMSAAVRVHE